MRRTRLGFCTSSSCQTTMRNHTRKTRAIFESGAERKADGWKMQKEWEKIAMHTSSSLDQLGCSRRLLGFRNRHDREFVMVIARLKPWQGSCVSPPSHPNNNRGTVQSSEGVIITNRQGSYSVRDMRATQQVIQTTYIHTEIGDIRELCSSEKDIKR